MAFELENNQSSPKARGERLAYIRRSILRLSRHEFQERHKDLRISARSLENWETARFKGLKEENVDLLLKAFKQEGIICEKYWLLDGIGNRPVFEGFFRQAVELSQFHSIATNESSEIEKITKELKAFRENEVDSVNTIIQDEALNPNILPGDWVAGIRHIGKEIEDVIGYACIVQITPDKTVTRKIKKGSKSGLFKLVPTNPKFQEKQKDIYQDVQLLSAAPIIWWRRPFSKK
jgi:hypothetical protein